MGSEYFYCRRRKILGRKELLQRLGQMLVTLIGVTILTFGLTYIAPGDAVDAILETGDTLVSAEVVEQTRHELGLDQPFHIQYLNWLTGLLHGDMGISYSAKMPVVDRMLLGAPGTLALTGIAIVMMLVVSVPAGIAAAVYRNSFIDYLSRVLSFLGVSMPSFWVGLLMLYIFGLKLGMFPISGGEVDLRHMVLPAATLSVVMISKFTRQVRTAVLEELGKDYVTGAQARGIPMNKILWHHVLPNACLPLVTLLGTYIGWLLGGVAVVEMVFAWPGLGFMAVRAIMTRDFPLLMGFVLWIAIAYMVINLIVDASYYILNPRLKKRGGE